MVFYNSSIYKAIVQKGRDVLAIHPYHEPCIFYKAINLQVINLILTKMKKTQKDSNELTLSKTRQELTKTLFNWDTSDLEKEVFNVK